MVARLVPAGRAGAAAEAVAALAAAGAAGTAATALDFGGWNEPDWRAGVFALCCAAFAIAIVRLVRLRAATS
jgi:hypothetical protein